MLVALAVVGIVAFLMFEVSQVPESAGGNWPVTQANVDHPIANTFGELIEYRTRDSDSGEIKAGPFRRRHSGVDILAEPCCGPSAPEVVVTAGGKVSVWSIETNNNYNYVEILATEGTRSYRYTYMHLENPPDPNSYVAYVENDPISSGSKISKVRNAFPCEYDHLHYEVAEITKDNYGRTTATYRNPLEKIAPEPDFSPPVISYVFLARHDPPRWSVLTPGNSCTVVSGKVDVIAQVSDRDDAGSPEPAAGNVGIYDVKWRACGPADPDCDWNDTHRFDGMPSSWMNNNHPSIEEHFSFTPPWETIREEWTDEPPQAEWGDVCPIQPVTYIVVSEGGGAATWDTEERVNGVAKYPNGTYVLSVRAVDFAGLDDIDDVNVCVQNGGS